MAETNRTWMRFQWRMHKLIWNLSGGRLGQKVVGLPVLELVTIGHKSGQERQILITYFGSDDAPIIVGTNAGDLISEASLAVELGATAEDMARTIHPHPTFSETIMETADVYFGHSAHYVKRKQVEG